jgi:5-hydroxyisourate hydrolase-like protein (transthyretin family)
MIQLSKYIKFFWGISLLTILCFAFLSSSAQKKQKAYMSMEYKQIINEYRLIEVTLRTRIDGKFQPIPDAPIDIFMNTEDDEILLATIHSNEDGLASMAIDKNYSYFKDEEGKYTLIAKFKSNDIFKKATKKIKARDLIIHADFTTIDSVKTIQINALEFIKDSLSIPEKEIKFEVFVDRLFADLRLTNGDLINGKAQVSIVDDIPGDPKGNIKLILLIDEKDYQTVELTKNIKWGVPLVKEEVRGKNATTISYVIFMIISIIVIAVFGLLLSKRIGNKS